MKLEEQELRDQRLSKEHHAEAKRDLLVRGYVVLENVLPPSKVDALSERFHELLAVNHRAVGDNRGRQRQGGVPLPIEAPFADPEVLGNSLALDLLADLLDGDLICSYFSSDTPMPGSEYQPAHRDGKYLFPGLPVIIPPYMYELNIPLVDFREDNGPLEVWPHSHLFHDLKLGDPTTVTSTFNTTTKTEIQQYADDLEPRAVLMPAGSFLLRDPRMWHRGTPNRSDAPRPMLSISYHRPWYRFNSVSVSRDIYDAWPERLQAIFRLACIDGVHSTEFG